MTFLSNRTNINGAVTNQQYGCPILCPWKFLNTFQRHGMCYSNLHSDLVAVAFVDAYRSFSGIPNICLCVVDLHMKKSHYVGKVFLHSLEQKQYQNNCRGSASHMSQICEKMAWDHDNWLTCSLWRDHSGGGLKWSILRWSTWKHPDILLMSFLSPEVAILDGNFSRGSDPGLAAPATHMAGAVVLDWSGEKDWTSEYSLLSPAFPSIAAVPCH